MADAARKKLEDVSSSQPAEPREMTSAERSAALTSDVRARLASKGEIKGQVPQTSHQITSNRVQRPEMQWRAWDVIPEFGTEFAELLDPSYWAHVARLLRPWDQLYVRAEDGSMYAECIVLECGQLYAKVAVKPGYPVKLQVSEPDLDTTIPKNYEIKWCGPMHKFCVIRDGKDKLSSGYQDKSAAHTWLSNHLRTLRATPQAISG